MRRRGFAQRFIGHIVLTIACLLAVFPLCWVALSSFKQEVAAQAPAIEAFNFTPTLTNYQQLFSSPLFINDAMTTVVITVSTTILALVIGTLAAYGFARFRVPGRRVLVSMLVLVQVVPAIVLLIPLYRIVSSLGLYDQPIAVIIAQTGLLTPFVTWLMLAFFRSIPVEIEEAALVDGVNRLQLFRHVLLPMLAPGLVAASLFTAIAAWNSFILPVILGQSHTVTLTAFIGKYITQEQLQWAQMCATGLVIMAPIVIVSLLLQRHLVAGVTAGSLK